MRRLRIGIIDLITKAPNRSLWSRLMHANMTGIMPQVIASWCDQLGHDVTLFYFTGLENLAADVPKDIDIVFMSAFTQSAQQAYALSNRYRSEGVITALGGPHARCYPQDAQKYFDYVLGLTDKNLIHDLLKYCSRNRPLGDCLSATHQPNTLPGVRERWKYIEQAVKKASVVKLVPMIGSVGCPYTCSFCIDSTEPYQPLNFDILKDDLKFLLTKFKRPFVSWYDPNFGVRFNDYMEAIEEAIPPNSIDFIAESSLSLLSEPHLKRLKHNGFKVLLPGIESWYGMGDKSKTGKKEGMEKLTVVSEHVNTILRYVPYVQTNFIIGLDCDQGPESFELTKKFVDLSPAAFPAYPLLTAFGQAAPINLQYQRENRVIPFPFHFLNNSHAMNVKPKHFSWTQFYDHLIDLAEHSFSWGSIFNRFRASTSKIPRVLNFIRAISTEGSGRLNFYREVRRNLGADRKFRDYFEGETTVLPQFYKNILKKDLGVLWEWLPEGALDHDPNAYLNAEPEKKAQAVNF